jgi:glycosyltransferase involved in cell wall biosynthesis
MNLSIIVPSCRPTSLAHVLGYLDRQYTDGLVWEIIIVQEADDFNKFQTLRYPHRAQIIRQPLSHDNGAIARDNGLFIAKGDYLAFWDDDNIYYPHAVATLFATANGHDVGVVHIRHHGTTLPSGRAFRAGDIDSMNFCVRREIAAKVKWADNGGRYNDYRWISKVSALINTVSYCPIIIGEHL